MTDDKNDIFKWDIELSDREVFLIGKIIAQWGALEYEIFIQTLLTFDTSDGEETSLPKAMNNLQFTGILKQWKTRVVDKARGERANLLQQQFDEIIRLKEYRDALVHGMWEWSADELAKISTVRIRKKEIITIHFTADDLNDFYDRLAGINFKIRYPDGVEDLTRKLAERGFYISRRALSQLTGDRVAGGWLSPMPGPKGEANE